MKQTLKKSELKSMKKLDARITLFMRKRVALTVVLYALFFLLLRPYVIPLLKPWSNIISLICLIAAYFIPYFVFRRSIKRGEDIELMRLREERREQKVIELQMKLEQIKKNLAETVEEARSSYAVTNVYLANEPYVLHLGLNEPLQEYPEGKYLLPKITINGVLVTTEAIGNDRLWCHIRKAINAEDTELVISTGKYKTTVANPYYLNFSSTEQIEWQCEGHNHERRIKIPASYFPNSHPSVQYPFALYVHKSCRGVFFGKLIPKEKAVIVALDKTVHRSQCDGKQAWLRVDYGRGNRILLPEPGLIAV